MSTYNIYLFFVTVELNNIAYVKKKITDTRAENIFI